MKKIRNKNLFTLLEVLVSMGVFALLMLALMQFFSAAQGVWERSGSKSELFDSARITAQLLTQDLATAFYGDEYHSMGDTGNNYIFFKNETVSSKVHLTFAAQRGGDEGLTAVNYVWNPADLTLSIQQKHEKDATVGADGWVTYPSNTWISKIRDETINQAKPFAEDVLYINFDDTTYRISGDAYRPPRMVIATFALLSPAGYEKLETLFKAVKSDASENDIKGAVKGFFDKMVLVDPGKPSDVQFKSVDDAVKQESDDPANFKAVSVPAKQIIYDNVQFFKLIIPAGQ